MCAVEVHNRQDSGKVSVGSAEQRWATGTHFPDGSGYLPGF
jgi:hypothetical protein